MFFPLQSPGSPRSGNPGKMGKNYKVPLPGPTPKNGEKLPKNYKKYSEKLMHFCNFSVIFPHFRGLDRGGEFCNFSPFPGVLVESHSQASKTLCLNAYRSLNSVLSKARLLKHNFPVHGKKTHPIFNRGFAKGVAGTVSLPKFSAFFRFLPFFFQFSLFSFPFSSVFFRFLPFVPRFFPFSSPFPFLLFFSGSDFSVFFPFFSFFFRFFPFLSVFFRFFPFSSFFPFHFQKKKTGRYRSRDPFCEALIQSRRKVSRS